MSLLDKVGGGTSLKFETIGTVHRGTLVAAPEEKKVKSKFHPDGQDALVFHLLVNGERKTLIAAMPGWMFGAIVDATRAAGADDWKVGDTLAVKYVRDEPSDKGNPAKIYEARYEVAVPSTPVSDFDGGTSDEEPF